MAPARDLGAYWATPTGHTDWPHRPGHTDWPHRPAHIDRATPTGPGPVSHIHLQNLDFPAMSYPSMQ